MSKVRARSAAVQAPGGDRMDFPSGLVVPEDVVAGRAVLRVALRLVRVVPVHVALDVDRGSPREVRRGAGLGLPAAVDGVVVAGMGAALLAGDAVVSLGGPVGS